MFVSFPLYTFLVRFLFLTHMLYTKNDFIEEVERFFKEKNERIIETGSCSSSFSNFVLIVKTCISVYVCRKFLNNKISNEKIIRHYIDEPCILYENEGFRVEEYLEHEGVDLIMDLKTIAKSVKRFHNIKIKEPILNYNQVLEYFVDYKDRELLKKVKLFIPNTKKTNNLIHMDLQNGNMLKTGKDKIVLIDFEYSCMGPFTLDIANFFCEKMSCYKGKTVEMDTDLSFTKQQKIEFINEYLGTKNDDNHELLLQEIEHMSIYSHLFWYLWARNIIKNNIIPNSDFDYKDYGLMRIKYMKDNKLITEEDYNYFKSEIENI